ncbi:hypothetical protein [Neokomagataea tanensis]|nr:MULTISPECIES: hypothetical protein [Neokomagataea]
MPKGFALIGDKSVSDYMATFFVALPGFFIAALAAVVAFNGGDLDKKMPGVIAKITVYGDTENINITLRMFLSYLFGYLTIISFMGFFICISGSLLSPNLSLPAYGNHNSYISYAHEFLKVLFLFIISFLGSNVICCTSIGLYFLSERVYQTILPDSDEFDKDK